MNAPKVSLTLCLLAIIIVIYSCEKKVLPTVTTADITNITGTSATSGGTISDEGSGTVVERGICWSKGITPTITDNYTLEGGGAGTFASNIENLEPATNYYVRAYAKNEAGIGYGMAMAFKTMGTAPGAVTQPATNVTTTSAVLNGSVNPNYISTTVSFEYGISTSYGNMVTAAQSPVTGNVPVNVNANLSGLPVGTIYHFRVKTVNSEGTIYGDDLTFKSLGELPMVIVTSVTNKTAESIKLNGTVNANHLETTVTFEYGLTNTYGTTINAIPALVTGSTNTNVNAVLSGLSPATNYHYRIKATNMLGTTYSDDITFVTFGEAPTVVTMGATNPTESGATLNGTVNPNYFLTTVSFEYGATTSYGLSVPALPNSVTGNNDVNVSAQITDLLEGIDYHFRIKAVNSMGTTYGDDVTFTLDPTKITDIDGNIYDIVSIGTQIWMADNLNTKKFQNGDPIETTTPSTLDILSETTPKYNWAYNGNESNAYIYGRLYTWYAITDTRKICPSGWHVPTDEDWTILISYLGGELYAGGKMKEQGTTHWISPNVGATNSSGFTGLPGGARHTNSFEAIGYFGYFWSNSSVDATNAWMRELDRGDTKVRRMIAPKMEGFSVRCIKD